MGEKMSEQTLHSEKLIEKIMTYATTKQIVIGKDAIFQMSNNNYIDIINDADEKGIFVINKDFVLEFLKEHPEIKETEELPQDHKIVTGQFPTEILKSIYIPAADNDSDLIIPKEEYISDKEKFKGDISDFQEYFLTRYKELKKILMKHPNINPISSKALKFMKEGESVCLIGMVYEKRISKKGNTVLTLDDLDGQFKVVISPTSKLIGFEKLVIIEDVISVKGRCFGNGMIFAEEIEYPGMTNRTMKKANRNLNLLVTSDIHIGSKLYYDDMFKEFIEWLNCKNVSSVEREEINKIKYIIFNGDCVDGIGVYPQQLTELNVIEIYEQYEILANYLAQIPEYVEILILPGNHDAVRRADPQPQISKDFAKGLYDLKNCHMIGSPAWAQIEGINVLAYHGNSMNTLQLQLKIDPTKPELAMEQYLLRRDLSSVYGEKQPNIPDKKGIMLIKKEPDIFVTGHIHSNGYKYYNGCLAVNPGCWQAQTVFQKEQGHIPTPGRVPIIQLNKGMYFEKVFNNGNPNIPL